MECLFLDDCQVVRKFDISQLATIVESLFSYCSHAVGDDDGGQATTIEYIKY